MKVFKDPTPVKKPQGVCFEYMSFHEVVQSTKHIRFCETTLSIHSHSSDNEVKLC